MIPSDEDEGDQEEKWLPQDAQWLLLCAGLLWGYSRDTPGMLQRYSGAAPGLLQGYSGDAPGILQGCSGAAPGILR